MRTKKERAIKWPFLGGFADLTWRFCNAVEERSPLPDFQSFRRPSRNPGRDRPIQEGLDRRKALRHPELRKGIGKKGGEIRQENSCDRIRAGLLKPSGLDEPVPNGPGDEKDKVKSSLEMALPK